MNNFLVLRTKFVFVRKSSTALGMKTTKKNSSAHTYNYTVSKELNLLPVLIYLFILFVIDHERKNIITINLILSLLSILFLPKILLLEVSNVYCLILGSESIILR